MANHDAAPHVEGRFSALETEVSSLKHGQESLERQVIEGFKTVFAKIDAMGSSRAASTVPWIMVGFAILSLVATVGFQAVNNISSQVLKGDAALAQANLREIDNAKEKGKMEERSAQLQDRVKDERAENRDFTDNMRAWRLAHEEASSYSRGKQDAEIAAVQREQQRIEQRQYDDHNNVKWKASN